MLTLYVRTGCGYCAKVLRAGEELGIDFTLKNVSEPGVITELIAKGGKRQEPYLIDDERGVAMYEADDIVRYLREHYSPNPASV
jgi:glutathione S-transferase